MNYRGWNIYQGPEHPITGRWRATRFGVTMGAGTREDLGRMIDAKIADTARERALRKYGLKVGDTVKLRPGTRFVRCPEGRENNATAKIAAIVGPDFDELRMERDLRGCLWWNADDVELVPGGAR